MKKGKKDEDYPHFPTFFTFYPFYLLLFSTIIIFTLLLFPDFVIASPKNLHQRVWRFSDALPSTLSECIHPCSEVA